MDIGKTAIVTGSSRGIGKAIARALGLNGYNLVLNASMSKQELIHTCDEFTKDGIACIGIMGDMSKYEDCQELFKKAIEIFGPVSVLVNNAGISYVGLFSQMEPSQWHNLIDANLNSVLNCTHLALADMVQAHAGAIINISSIWGERGASCEAVYSASKGGINAFTKAMAKELGPTGIRVNVIACGVINTQMNDWLSPDEEAVLKEEISLLRFGSPDDVAKLAVYLAGSDAGFLTGQVITLDGGMV